MGASKPARVSVQVPRPRYLPHRGPLPTHPQVPSRDITRTSLPPFLTFDEQVCSTMMEHHEWFLGFLFLSFVPTGCIDIYKRRRASCSQCQITEKFQLMTEARGYSNVPIHNRKRAETPVVRLVCTSLYTFSNLLYLCIAELVSL